MPVSGMIIRLWAEVRQPGVGSETIVAACAPLAMPDQQGDYARDGNEGDEDEPSRLVDVMQPADIDAQRRQYQGYHDHKDEEECENPRTGRQKCKQVEVPIFRSGSPAVEIRIIAKAGPNRFHKTHFDPRFLFLCAEAALHPFGCRSSPT
jgi:hypothetical protein